MVYISNEMQLALHKLETVCGKAIIVYDWGNIWRVVVRDHVGVITGRNMSKDSTSTCAILEICKELGYLEKDWVY